MRPPRLILSLLTPTLIGALALTTPALAQSQKPDPAQLKRAQQKAKRDAVLLGDANATPVDAPRPMHEVCALKTANGRLTLKNLLGPLRKDPNPTQFRITVPGLPEPLFVSDGGAAEPATFRLTTRNFSDDRAVAIDTQLDLEAGVLSLTRTTRFLNAFADLTLIQSDGQDNSLEPGIALTYNYRPQRGEPVTQNFTAADFASLRREHPDAVNRLLRPVLRDLQLSSAFNVELRDAFHAFADDWQPSEETRAKVARLLPDLDSDQPARRDAAVTQLRKLGLEGALALLHLNRATLTPEQTARIDVLLAPYASPSDAARKRLRRDPQFLCDCLYSDDPRITSSAARQLERLTGAKVTIDLTLPPPRRVEAVESLRDRVLNQIP